MDTDTSTPLTRAQRRAASTPAIARFTRSPEFRAEYSEIPGASRSYTVLPALPDDSMGYVLGILEQQPGQPGVIVMVDGSATLKVAILFPASAARLQVAREENAMLGVHDDSSVEMFFDALKTCRQDPVVIERVAARLITHELCS